MDWAFSDKVEHLFVSMRIILNTRACADDNSPGAVGGKDKDWVVNSTELGVNDRLHFVPLVELDRVLGDVCTEGSGSVAVRPVALWKLRLVVHAIGLHEALEVPPWLVKPVANLVYEREIAAVCLRRCKQRTSNLLANSSGEVLKGHHLYNL